MLLKEYQLVGLNWLWLMWRMRLGGILADEMGLGKTVQVIALLCAIQQSQGGGGVSSSSAPSSPTTHLVVAPASTLDNWCREFGTWAPTLVIAKYHGPQATRMKLQAELDDDGFDVLITTYSYFEGEAAAGYADRKWLKRRRWGLCVLDEAHALKSATSSRAIRLSQLNVTQRLLLTGTPVQNNLHELLTLLSFMLPAVFPASTAEAFAEVERAKREATAGCSTEQLDAAAVRRVRRMLAPFVLRRRKETVLTQLVAKIEHERFLSMTPRQSAIYLERLQAAAAAKGGAAEGASAKGAKAKAKAKAAKGAGAAISLFSNLRKAANHPCLVRSIYTDAQVERIAKAAQASAHFGEKATLKQVREEIVEYSDFQLHLICQEHASLSELVLSNDVLLDSAKMQMLSTLLPQLKAGGHRCLIFSQHLEMLNLLEVLLGPGGLKLKFVRLDGGTPVSTHRSPPAHRPVWPIAPSDPSPRLTHRPVSPPRLVSPPHLRALTRALSLDAHRWMSGRR